MTKVNTSRTNPITNWINKWCISYLRGHCIRPTQFQLPRRGELLSKCAARYCVLLLQCHVVGAIKYCIQKVKNKFTNFKSWESRRKVWCGNSLSLSLVPMGQNLNVKSSQHTVLHLQDSPNDEGPLLTDSQVSFSI